MAHWLGSFDSLIRSSFALAPPATRTNAESASQNRDDFIAFFPPELAYLIVKAAMLFHFGLTHKRATPAFAAGRCVRTASATASISDARRAIPRHSVGLAPG